MKRLLNNKELIGQVLRFGVVGGGATAINYGVFFVLLNYANFEYRVASAVGYLVGVVVGYFFNKKWTFNASTSAKQDTWKYLSVYLISLLISIWFLTIAKGVFGMSALLANLFAVVLTTITNFIGTKFWAFNATSINKRNSAFYDPKGMFKLPIFRSKLFWIGFAIKILLGSTLASDYLTGLFAPFIDYFVTSGFKNPYQYFIATQPDAFPYPYLMLFVLAVPRVLLSPFFEVGQSVGIWHLISIRIVLFIADFSILAILYRWIRNRGRMLMLLYWLNPVLIYISYVHGQLDVIPISLLIISLYFLFKNKYLPSILFMAFAISTKFNMVLALPFYLVYIYFKENNLKFLVKYGLILVASIFLFNLPYLFSHGYLTMVYTNQQQARIYDVVYNFGEGKIFYFVPAVLLILFFRNLTLNVFSKDTFIMFLGFSFGALVFFIPPNQGWYYWFFPFFAYYYIKEVESPKYLFVLLMATYFLYFLIIPNSDYLSVFQLILPKLSSYSLYSFGEQIWGGANGRFLNMIFTSMQTLLALNVIWIYQKGLLRSTQHKLYNKPFLLGIGGDSASGKSSLTDAITDCFGEKSVTAMRGDDMHKWERGNVMWKTYTHLNPLANNLQKNIEDLQNLGQGKKISRRHYDHNTGKFTEPLLIKPNRLIIFEGLHTFYLKKSQQSYDLKIFMLPSESLRRYWKVKRDVAKRGYSVDKVLEQIEARYADGKQYIDTQAKLANLIFTLNDRNTEPIEDYNTYEPNLDLWVKSDGNIDLEPLIELIPTFCPQLEVTSSYDDEHWFNVNFYGNVTSDQIVDLHSNLITDLDEIIPFPPKYHNGYSGIMQLIVVYSVFVRKN